MLCCRLLTDLIAMATGFLSAIWTFLHQHKLSSVSIKPDAAGLCCLSMYDCAHKLMPAVSAQAFFLMPLI